MDEVKDQNLKGWSQQGNSIAAKKYTALDLQHY